MKKIALVLTVFTASIIGAKAQVNFGVKAGANMYTFTGDASGAKSKIGFNGGVLVNIPVADHLSVQPEAVYSLQGAKADGADFKYNMSYVNIPVLVKYSLPVGVFFQTGPQLGILVSAKAKTGSSSEDIKSSFKSTDFSWAFGAGYLIPDVNLGFDLRYNLGLANIVKTDGDGSLKNAGFQLGVFYMFGGGSSKSSKK